MTLPTRRPKKQLVTKRMTVPGNFRRACDDFNDGRFFEAHEWLEEVWQQEQGPVRDLYKGLIQIAAGFVHISRANDFGANRLLTTGIGYLAAYRPDGAMGWDVEAIAGAAEDALTRARALAGARLGEFEIGKRPVYGFDPGALRVEALKWRAWGFDPTGRPVEMEITVAE